MTRLILRQTLLVTRLFRWYFEGFLVDGSLEALGPSENAPQLGLQASNSLHTAFARKVYTVFSIQINTSTIKTFISSDCRCCAYCAEPFGNDIGFKSF